MRIPKIKKKFLLLVALAVIGIFLFSSLAQEGSSPVGDFVATKDKVVCDVTVGNQALKAPVLSDATCQRKVNACVFNLNFAPLGIFSDQVRVVLDYGDANSAVFLKVTEGKSATATLEVCTNNPSGVIKLYGEEGQLLATQGTTV